MNTETATLTAGRFANVRDSLRAKVLQGFVRESLEGVRSAHVLAPGEGINDTEMPVVEVTFGTFGEPCKVSFYGFTDEGIALIC